MNPMLSLLKLNYEPSVMGQRKPLYNILKIKENINMSNIIELDIYKSEVVSQRFKRTLIEVFKDPIFHCSKFVDGKTIQFFLRASRQTFRLASHWEFKFNMPYLIILIKFYTFQEDTFVRAMTQRTKLQFSILLRNIQKSIPRYKFFTQSETGIFHIELLHNLQQLDKINQLPFLYGCLKNIIINEISFIKNYEEIIMFLEPSLKVIKSKQRSKQIEGKYHRINKFRCFLKDTKKRRDILSYYSSKLHQARRIGVPQEHLYELRKLFYDNVVAFHESQIGVDPNIDESEKYQNEYINIQKIRTGRVANNSNQIENIVNGIVIRKDKKPKVKSLSQGSHCQVFLTYIHYGTIATINLQTINIDDEEKKREWQDQIQFTEGQLVYKQIKNAREQSSRNSYLNQIKILQYLKNKQFPYIARYYLPLVWRKQRWDQNDRIFMKKYKTNLYDFLMNHQKSLGIQIRLKLAYQVARALCFLSSVNILHRDFKPQNIVLDKSLMIHIIDFGSSAPIHNSPHPKVHDQRLLTTPNCHIRWNQLNFEDKRAIGDKNAYQKHKLFDVMGLGWVLCLIFFGRSTLPTIESLQQEISYEILQNIYFLIQLCFKHNPDDRPDFSEIVAFLDCLRGLNPQKWGQEVFTNIMQDEDCQI